MLLTVLCTILYTGTEVAGLDGLIREKKTFLPALSTLLLGILYYKLCYTVIYTILLINLALSCTGYTPMYTINYTILVLLYTTVHKHQGHC